MDGYDNRRRSGYNYNPFDAIQSTPYVSMRNDLPFDLYKHSLDKAEQRHEQGTQIQNELELLLGNLRPVGDASSQLLDEKKEGLRNKIATLTESAIGGLANPTVLNNMRKIATEYMTDPELAHLADYQEKKKTFDNLRMQREIESPGSTIQTRQGTEDAFGYDEDNNLVSLDFTPDWEGKLNWDGLKSNLIKETFQDRVVSQNIAALNKAAKEGDELFLETQQTAIKGYRDDLMGKLNIAFDRYLESNEGQQELRNKTFAVADSDQAMQEMKDDFTNMARSLAQSELNIGMAQNPLFGTGSDPDATNPLGITSPSRMDAATENISRKDVDKKYSSVNKTLDRISRIEKEIEDNSNFLNENIYPTEIKNPKKYIESLSPEELDETLNAINSPKIVKGRHIIEDENTGLLKLNPNFIKESYDTGTLESMIAREVEQLGTKGRTFRNTLEKDQQKIEEFKQQNPLIGSITDSNPDITFKDAIEITKDFEEREAMQHFSLTKITSKEATDGILTAVTSANLPDLGETTWRRGNGKIGKTEGGLELIRSLEPKDIKNIEIRTATGELVFTVRDGNTTKFVSLPANTLYSGSEEILSSAQNLFSKARSLDTPIDSFSDPVNIAGLSVREGKILNDNNKIISVLQVMIGHEDDFNEIPENLFVDDDGTVWGPIDSGWIGQHVTSALTVGEGYTTKIQSNLIKAFNK